MNNLLRAQLILYLRYVTDILLHFLKDLTDEGRT